MTHVTLVTVHGYGTNWELWATAEGLWGFLSSACVRSAAYSPSTQQRLRQQRALALTRSFTELA